MDEKIKKVGDKEYELGAFSISHKSGTDWTVSGPGSDGGFFRSTVESFKEAKEVAREVIEQNGEEEEGQCYECDECNGPVCMNFLFKEK